MSLDQRRLQQTFYEPLNHDDVAVGVGRAHEVGDACEIFSAWNQEQFRYKNFNKLPNGLNYGTKNIPSILIAKTAFFFHFSHR